MTALGDRPTERDYTVSISVRVRASSLLDATTKGIRQLDSGAGTLTTKEGSA